MVRQLDHPRLRDGLRGAVIGVTLTLALTLLIGLSSASSNRSAVDVAARDVSQRVTFVQQTLARSHIRAPRAYLISLAAMSYVLGHVSASQYGYLRDIAHQRLAPTADAALQADAGICGNATIALLAILKRLQIRARHVTVFYSTPQARDNGHATVEVWYDRAWHWFDPTWGTVYVRPHTPEWDVLALVDVLKLPPAKQRAARLGDDTRLWTRVVAAAGHSLGVETGMLFLTLPHLRVQVDGNVVYRR